MYLPLSLVLSILLALAVAVVRSLVHFNARSLFHSLHLSCTHAHTRTQTQNNSRALLFSLSLKLLHSLSLSLGGGCRPRRWRCCRCLRGRRCIRLEHTCRMPHSRKILCTPQARKQCTPFRPPPPTPECIGRLSPTLTPLLIRRAPGSSCRLRLTHRCRTCNSSAPIV